MARSAIFDTQGAAAYCLCSASLLNKLRLRGEGPDFTRLGVKIVRYTKPNLDRWIAKGKRKASAYDRRKAAKASSKKT